MEKYCVVLKGGSIGERLTGCYDMQGRRFIQLSDTKEEAKEISKAYNKILSPGEKSYYKMKYSAIKYNENKFKTR